MRRTRNLQVILVAAILVIVGISVAYAALSTTLTITTNKVTSDVLTWNIGFNGTSATATAGGTSATGRTCPNATISSTAVTLGEIKLSKPDDSCTYQLTIKNNGTIAGVLSQITPSNPTGTGVSCGTSSGATMVCGNITYKLTTDSSGDTLLNTTSNATLAASGTRNIYLVVKYTGTTLNTSTVTQSGARFSLKYDQA